MNSEKVKIAIYFDDDVTDGFIEEKAQDYELRKDEEGMKEQALDPLSVAIYIGLAYAASLLIWDAIEKRRGGSVIDVRKEPVDIKRTRKLPFGMVAIIATNGDVEINVKELPKTATERILNKILELTIPVSAEDVKSVVESVTGAINKDD